MGLFNRAKLNRRVQKTFVPPEGVWPICPHCEQTIQGIFVQEVSLPFGKTWMHFCRSCSKVLGMSQRKGFWMG